MNFLLSLIESLIDFLFPKSKKVLVLENLTASQLLTTLPPATGPDEDNVTALFEYAHPVVKEIIWEVKYGGNKTLANTLGEVLYDVINQELAERNVLEKFDKVILLPMPISGKRRFERGWNQAELLAKAVKERDIQNYFKYYPGQLVKFRHTESQTKTASKSERKQNLAGSMKVMNPHAVENQFCILIDDVVTTGSTFAEARRALKEAGAKKILCVAVAH